MRWWRKTKAETPRRVLGQLPLRQLPIHRQETRGSRSWLQGTQLSISSMPRHQISDFVSIPLPHVPVGGWLKHFLPQLKAITSDPFILNMVTGMDIPLENRQPQVSIPPELVFSEAEKQAADEQIQTLLNKHAIVECFHIGPDDFVSNVFLRPKKGGSYCMILNLKKFNDFVQYEHFKMETL